MKITKKGMGICFLVVNPTYCMTPSGRGVVGPLRFSKFPLSDHGVHAKIVQPPRAALLRLLIFLYKLSMSEWISFLSYADKQHSGL